MKRSGEGLGDGGRRGGPKLGKAGKFGPCAFKVLCPEQMVAKMMGSQGATVHQIENRTSSHLQFSPRGEYYPDTKLRILTIHAPEPNLVLDALASLLDQVAIRADEERPTVKGRTIGDFVDGAGKLIFRCALSKAAAGAIIGTKGERVRSLRDSTGCLLDIAREVVDNHQLVTLGGARDQLLSVLDQLNSTVQADVDAPWFSDWAEQRGLAGDGSGPRKPPQRPSGTGSRGNQRSEEHRDCTIFVGHLAQTTDADGLRSYFSSFGRVVDADVRTDPTTNRSKGFGFVTFSEPSMAEAVFAHFEDHEIDERRVDVKRYGDSSTDPAPRSERDMPRPSLREDEFDRDRRSDRHEHNGRGAHQLDARGPGRDPVQWFAGLVDTVPPDYLNLDYCIACSLPSAKCGALIGRRGEHVAEVQRITGATVSVGKKDPNESLDAYRTVTITGQLLSVYAAHLLLMRHYNDEEAQFRASQEGGGLRDGGRRHEGAQIEDLQRQLTVLSEELARVRGNQGGSRRRSPLRPRAW